MPKQLALMPLARTDTDPREAKDHFVRFNQSTLILFFTFFTGAEATRLALTCKFFRDAAQVFYSGLYITRDISRELVIVYDEKTAMPQSVRADGVLEASTTTFYRDHFVSVIKAIEEEKSNPSFSRGLIQELTLLASLKAVEAFRYLLTRYPSELHKFFPMEQKEEQFNSVPDVWFEAVSSGSKELVALFLQYGVAVTSSIGRLNALHFAAQKGFSEIVKLLIDEGRAHKRIYGQPFINAQTHAKQTALMLAAAEGHEDVCKVLIQAGADCCIKNRNDQIVLYYCLASPSISPTQQFAIFNLLKPHIPARELQIRDKNGETLAQVAARCVVSPYILQELQQMGADFSVPVFESEETVFHLVANSKAKEADQLAALRFFCSKFKTAILFDTPAKNGQTPLCYAVAAKNEAVTQFLLRQHLKSIRDNKISAEFMLGIKALAKSGDLASFKIIFDYLKEKKPILEDILNNTWFDVIGSGNSTLVEFFLQHNVRYWARNEKGETAFHLTANSDKIAVLQLLIAKGCATKWVRHKGHKKRLINVSSDTNTPLAQAVRNESLAAVDQLLEAKADAAILTKSEFYPLYLALLRLPNSIEIVLRLIEHTPKKLLDLRVNDRSPLFLLAAGMAAPLCVFQKLFEKHIDADVVVNSRSIPHRNGMNVFHLWVETSYPKPHQRDVLELLAVHAGHLLDKRANNGWTPLYCAVKATNSEAVAFFLEKNVDVLAEFATPSGTKTDILGKAITDLNQKDPSQQAIIKLLVTHLRKLAAAEPSKKEQVLHSIQSARAALRKINLVNHAVFADLAHNLFVAENVISGKKIIQGVKPGARSELADPVPPPALRS